MLKRIIAILGIIVLISSLVIFKLLENAKNKALSLDDSKTSYGVISGDIPPCTWSSQLPEKVMAENKTQAIIVEVVSSKDSECESVISLRAPGFDISPSREEQTINLSKDKKGSISWILTPRKTGTFDVSVSDQIDTRIFGITVNNIFGLSAIQAKTASFLGTLFGPMLTVPWWWDRLKRKKTVQEEVKN